MATFLSDSPHPKTDRKYELYISTIDAIEGCNSGKYKRGELRVNKKKDDCAFVTAIGKDDASDYLIRGRKHRNRAIHGDMVVIEPIVNIEEEIIPLDDADIEDLEENKYTEKKPIMAKVVYKEGLESFLKPYVAALCPNSKERMECHQILESDRNVKAVPIDNRIPWILIPMGGVESFGLSPSKIDSTDLYLVQIIAWDEYSSLPKGKIIRFIGHSNDIKTEILSNILANSLESYTEEFSPQVKNEAKKIVQQSQQMFANEIKTRIDLRDLFVFTIDPTEARDLDDAIHIRKLRGTSFHEIGVHIADVSHFVKIDSAIDIAARERCTSVYLPHQTFPMLPAELCNNLCSLNPNEDKLAFSIVFEIDSEGYLPEFSVPRIFKSVIRSSCRLSYEEAQSIVDSEDSCSGNFPSLFNGKTTKTLSATLKTLHSITQCMRRNRFQNGSLKFEESRLRFIFLDALKVKSFSLSQHTSSHELIEELMLMANFLVADHLIHSSIRERSLLRSHAPPLPSSMSKIDTFLSKLEIDHNFTSSGAIQGSLLSIAENYGNLVSAAIEVLLRKPMSRANYFIMDKNLKKSSHHFALNFKYYTHFTSPIRRYADLLVHRLLWETISNKCIQKGENSLFMDIHPRMTKHILENQCTLCNYKRMKAKDASLACEWAFFCSYLRSLPHPCITVAVPCSIFSSSVEVCLPRLGRQAQLSFSPDTCLMDALSQRSKDRLKFPYSILFVNTHKINIFWTSEDCNNNQAQSLKILSCIPVFILPSTTSYTELFVSVIPPQDLLFQDQAGKLDALILGEISTKAFHLPEKFQDELNMPLKSLTEVSPKAT